MCDVGIKAVFRSIRRLVIENFGEAVNNGSVQSALERYIRTRSAMIVAPQVMEELALLISALVQVSHEKVNYAVDGRTKSEVAMFTLA